LAEDRSRALTLEGAAVNRQPLDIRDLQALRREQAIEEP